MAARQEQGTKSRKPRQAQTGRIRPELLQKLEDARLALDASPSALLVTRFDGSVIYANQRCSEQYGADLLSPGRNIVDIYETPTERQAVLKALRRTGRFDDHELRIRRSDGSPMWVLFSARLVTFDGEAAILSSLFDITELKRTEFELEESEQRFRATFDQAAIGIAHVTPEGQWIRMNQKLCDILGYSREELTGKKFMEITHPDDRAADRKATRRLLEGKQATFTREKRYIRKDGSIAWINLAVTLVRKPSGEPDYFVATSEDITERKQAEARLQESEERFACMSAAAFEGIGFNEKGRMVDANPQLARMLGYEPDELIGMEVMKIVAPESRQFVRERVQAGDEGPYEHLAQRRDGSIFPVEVRGNPILYKGRQMQVTIARDITERKRAEDQLRENQQRYQAIFDGVEDAIFVETTDGRILDVNRCACEMFGYSRERLLELTVTDLVPSADKVVAFDPADPRFLSDRPIETVNVRANGEQFPIEISFRVQTWNDQTVLLVVGRDITERKQAEQALAQSEEKFRTMIEQSTEGFALVDEGGLVIEWNRAKESIWGFKRTEVLGKPFYDVQFQAVTPERRTPERYEYLKTTLLEALRTGRSAVFDRVLEAELCKQDGTRVFIEQRIFPIKTSRGYRIASMSVDITERKRAEAALQASETRFRAIIENSHDAITLVDPNGIIRYVSPSNQHITGFDVEQRLGKNVLDSLHPEDRDMIARLMQDILQSPGRVEFPPVRVQRADGAWRWIEGVIHNLLDEPNVQAMVINFRDVTERQRAEEQLQILKYSIDTAPDGAYWMDEAGRFLYVNDSGCKVLGYSREELLKMRVSEINPRATPARWAEVWKQIRQGAAFTSQSMHRRKDGSEFPVEITSAYGKFGEQEYCNGFAKDITERKRAEENLKQQMERLRSLHTIEQAVTSSTDLNTVLGLLSHEVVEQLQIDAVSILLLNRRTQTLDFAAGEGFFTEALRYTNLAIGAGLAGQAAQSHTLIFIPDLTHVEDNPILSKSISGEDFVSYIGVPLVAKGQLCGVMEIFQRTPLVSNPEWFSYLETLAGQAAIAIDNASLLKMTQTHLKETEALYRINQGLVASIDPLQLMKDVVALLQKNFGYSYVQIFIREPVTGDFVVRAGSGRIGRKLVAEGYRLAAGEGIVGYTAETDTAFFTNNVDEVIFYKRNPLLPDTKSELAVPIKVGDQFLGLLDVHQVPPASLAQRDVQLVSTVADQLAVALQKARLYTDLQNSLRQEKETHAQLIHTEKLAVAGRLLASVSHELNNPLQAIQNALFLLEDEAGISAQGKQDLSIVVSEAERMASMLDRLRTTYQPVREEDFQPIQVNAIIEDVHALIATHLRHTSITFKSQLSPALPSIRGMAGQVRQVVLNLFMNAVDAMESGGQLTVATEYLAETQEIRIDVADTGPGIDPGILPHIFEPFITNKEKGTGLGLAISYEIVLNHAGRIQAENLPGNGALFRVWLPTGNGKKP